MGCIISLLRNKLVLVADSKSVNIVAAYEEYQFPEINKYRSCKDQIGSKYEVNINHLHKGKKTKNKYVTEETEEEKYGDLEPTVCCGLWPQDKDPLTDPRNQEPRKKEGKLKGVWIDGQYVNTELKDILEDQKCCKCKSLGQIRREKIDNRDDAYALYLQKLQEERTMTKKAKPLIT